MSILGIDYGDKKVGLAISNDKERLALPLSIIQNQGNSNLVQEIKKVCADHNISKIVIGLPLTLASKEKDFQNKQTKKVLKFIGLLKRSVRKIEVVTEDERLSTKMANGLYQGKIKVKGQDDAVAAMLILQSYLDKQNN